MDFIFVMSHRSSTTEADAKVKSSEPADPAALIAEALKRKFAHRYRHNSEREDNEDFQLPVREMEPQTETPLVRNVLFVFSINVIIILLLAVSQRCHNISHSFSLSFAALPV